MPEYKLPPHRRSLWLSMFLWSKLYEREEVGFVIKEGRKIHALYRLCGFYFFRWWKLIGILEEKE